MSCRHGSEYTLSTNDSKVIIPAFGLGTWVGSPKPEKAQLEALTAAVKTALACGYRHIDTAAFYGTEAAVGEAVKQSGVPRSEVFVTSKIWNADHAPADVSAAVESSLKNLDLEYIDLYLIHWPLCFCKATNKPVGGVCPVNNDGTAPAGHVCDKKVTAIIDTWRELEKYVDSGKIRALGVSNFSAAQTIELCKLAKHKPVANQIEVHPYLPADRVVRLLKPYGVAVIAYRPMANLVKNGAGGVPTLIEHPTITAIADRYGCSPAGAVLGWFAAKGMGAMVKSLTPERIRSNFEKIAVLAEEDVKAIDSLACNKRFCNSHLDWGLPTFFEEFLEADRLLKEATGKKVIA